MTDPRTALEAIGILPDTEIDIAGAALQFARIDAPDGDWTAAAAHLSALAREAVALRAAADLPDRAAALAGLLAARNGYAGDAQSYDDPRNANLIRVIERRRGLPVALGILWLHCAQAAGWPVHGVDFPGHFLVALEDGGRKAVLDVFAGGTPLDAAGLRALLKRIEGASAELRPGVLQPMAARDVLLRLQNNIVLRRLSAGDVPGALTCVDDMLLVAPLHAGLWRQAAVLNQRLDQVAAALRCFQKFLDLVPQGEAAARVRNAMDELRGRLN